MCHIPINKIVVKRFLKEGWCEPASGKDNSLPDCCEGVGVIPSEGGNTPAYLETERYRSMPIHPSACHCPTKLLQGKVPENETTESGSLHPVAVGSASDGSYSSLCSWVKGFDIIPPSAVFHPSRHGKVITDATFERQV